MLNTIAMIVVIVILIILAVLLSALTFYIALGIYDDIKERIRVRGK